MAMACVVQASLACDDFTESTGSGASVRLLLCAELNMKVQWAVARWLVKLRGPHGLPASAHEMKGIALGRSQGWPPSSKFDGDEKITWVKLG